MKRHGVPVEVIPLAYVPVMRKIIEQFKAQVTLRLAGVSKAGFNSLFFSLITPLTEIHECFICFDLGPVLTDNGNFILDCVFGAIKDPATLDLQLRSIPGVIMTGLFVGMVEKAYFGQADGSVTARGPVNK
jgi:ribose 5-phosphate isomerase A